MSSPIKSEPKTATAAQASAHAGDAADAGRPDPAQIAAAIQQLTGSLFLRNTSAQPASDAKGKDDATRGSGEHADAAQQIAAQMRQEREAHHVAHLVKGGSVKRLESEAQAAAAQEKAASALHVAPGLAPTEMLAGGASGAGFQPNDDLEVLSTLSKHMDRVPDIFSFDDLDKLSKDESLPPDLREAYAKLRDKPELLARLDNADLSGTRIHQRRHHDDHLIGHGDLRQAFNDPALVEYNRQKSEAYTRNYVPSDAVAGDASPRAMTESDAARELYLYADSLPDDIDAKELQRIVDGQCRGKCPAQLQAAAQYLLDHPESMAKIAPEGRVSRGALEDNTLKMVHLRKDEMDALDTLKDNKSLFMRDGEFITRESLARLAADTSVPKEVRDAATLLASNPLLFGMLDNGDRGHQASRGNKTHDGNISGGDVDKALAKLTSTNKTPQKPAPARADDSRTSAVDAAAMDDMAAGVVDDPALKQSRGGRRGLGLLSKILGGLSKVLDWVKTGLDALASVLPPPFGTIAGAIGAGVATVNNFGLKTGAAMLDGVDPRQAFKDAAKNYAWDMASSAMSMVPVGGIAGKAALQAARAGATGAMKVGVKEGVELGARESAKELAEAGTRTAVREGVEGGAGAGARQGGKVTGKEAGEQAGEHGTREALKEEGTDIVKDEASAAAQDQVLQRLPSRSQQGTAAGGGMLAPDLLSMMMMPTPAVAGTDKEDNDDDDDDDDVGKDKKKHEAHDSKPPVKVDVKNGQPLAH